VQPQQKTTAALDAKGQCRPIQLSAAIITYNEEQHLPGCLDSLAFCNEIILVDSGSHDRTLDIARSFGCRVFSHPWLGYARQKQLAIDRCYNDWVLILDADERVCAETAETIPRLLSEHNSSVAGFSLVRKNYFHGRWIRHCGWWPEHVLRLVNRNQGCYSQHLVHERWITNGVVKPTSLVVEHYSFRSYSALVEKMQTYSTLSATEMYQQGKQAHWWSPALHGAWTFMRTYFVHLGILDGFDGFMIAALNGGGSFLKYAKLREARCYGEHMLSL
jgi:(heptosyl)LPS beta-1,4-glucosyltransferase